MKELKFLRKKLTDSIYHKFGKIEFETSDFVYIESVTEYKNRVKEGVELTDFAKMSGCKTKFNKSLVLTRSVYEDDENYINAVMLPNGSAGGVLCDFFGAGVCPNISIELNSFLEDREEGKDYKICFENGKKFIEINALMYPQDRVGEDLEEILEREKLQKTGKRFFTLYEDPKILEENDYNKEVVYKDKLYAYVFDNKSNFDDKKKAFFVEVKPIKWEIKNFSNLPKILNSEGSGKAKSLELVSQKALFTLQMDNYFSYDEEKSDFFANDKNERALWQNSCVRAFLNSYDIFEEVKNNGNISFLSGKNYDFRERGFLEEMCHENNEEVRVLKEVRHNRKEDILKEISLKIKNMQEEVRDFKEMVKDNYHIKEIEKGRER